MNRTERRTAFSLSLPWVRGLKPTLRGGLKPTLRLALFALVVTVAQSASACAVCYGAPGDPMVKGMNNGIWVLLGLVAFVQIGFVAMFWSFWRRAREQRRFRESLRVIEGGSRR